MNRNTPYSQEEVEAKFAEYGYQVTSQYVRSFAPLSYVCPVGHKGAMTRVGFYAGHRCPKCKAVNQGNRCRFSLEYVQQYFRDNGCEPLFDEYSSNSQKLRYRCTCGNIAEISFAHFKDGQRCRSCFMERTWIQRNKNQSCITSLQQSYLHSLLGGELNHPIGTASLDIAFPKKMIYLEYDGSGHDQGVKLGKMSSNDFIQYQRRRTYKLYRQGWRVIRILSKKDLLPCDEKIHEQLAAGEQAIYDGSSFYEIDIDQGKIRNSTGEYDVVFGELRHIRKCQRGND